MTASLIRRRETCRLCGSAELTLVLPLAPSPIGDAYVLPDQRDRVQESYPVDLCLCQSCGHAQLRHVIDPDILYRDYLYVTQSSLGLVAHFGRYAQAVLAQVQPPAGALAIDVGSNDGALLRCFKQGGMRVLGVDPARDIARAATASGIETLPEYLTTDLARTIKATHGPATLVTANNVFANVDDLEGFTRAVRELLAPDGVFVFEVFYLADLIRNMVFDFIYHEHLDYHSIKPLSRFFARLGMELIDVQRTPVKCGSIRCTVQLAGGPRRASATVRDHIEEEARMGLHAPAIFAAFTRQIEAAKAAVGEALRQLQGQGKTIAGYGASVTGTALIYHFALGGFLDFIVDDNPAKQHRLSPGLHLPVVPAEALYERKPDVIVVLAWRYVEPIIRKHATFLDHGGEFLVPLPRLHRVSRRKIAEGVG